MLGERAREDPSRRERTCLPQHLLFHTSSLLKLSGAHPQQAVGTHRGREWTKDGGLGERVRTLVRQGDSDASRRALLSRNPGGERWGSTMGGGWKREQGTRVSVWGQSRAGATGPGAGSELEAVLAWPPPGPRTSSGCHLTRGRTCLPEHSCSLCVCQLRFTKRGGQRPLNTGFEGRPCPTPPWPGVVSTSACSSGQER